MDKYCLGFEDPRNATFAAITAAFNALCHLDRTNPILCRRPSSGVEWGCGFDILEMQQKARGSSSCNATVKGQKEVLEELKSGITSPSVSEAELAIACPRLGLTEEPQNPGVEVVDIPTTRALQVYHLLRRRRTDGLQAETKPPREHPSWRRGGSTFTLQCRRLRKRKGGEGHLRSDPGQKVPLEPTGHKGFNAFKCRYFGGFFKLVGH
ncbi:GL27052 [Drosophila persimilis]|uniref:GL27052 n=1 Tax=Drosophila persimilis TaxID=7234 RepID=B4HAQ9_DROPE|nr:GL27052 [Drosophila persimilis]